MALAHNQPEEAPKSLDSLERGGWEKCLAFCSTVVVSCGYCAEMASYCAESGVYCANSFVRKRAIIVRKELAIVRKTPYCAVLCGKGPVLCGKGASLCGIFWPYFWAPMFLDWPFSSFLHKLGRLVANSPRTLQTRTLRGKHAEKTRPQCEKCENSGFFSDCAQRELIQTLASKIPGFRAKIASAKDFLVRSGAPALKWGKNIIGKRIFIPTLSSCGAPALKMGCGLFWGAGAVSQNPLD